MKAFIVGVLALGSTQVFAQSAADVCNSLARFSSSGAADCLEAAADKSFTQDLASVVTTIANSGSSINTVNAVRNAANSWSTPGASAVCIELARFSSNGVPDCINSMKNKIYYNGSESVV